MPSENVETAYLKKLSIEIKLPILWTTYSMLIIIKHPLYKNHFCIFNDFFKLLTINSFFSIFQFISYYVFISNQLAKHSSSDTRDASPARPLF